MVRFHLVHNVVHILPINGVSYRQPPLASIVCGTFDTLSVSGNSLTPYPYELLHVQLFKNIPNSEPVPMHTQFILRHFNSIEIRTVCEPTITSESSWTLFDLYRDFIIDLHVNTSTTVHVHHHWCSVFSYLRTHHLLHS